MPTLRVVNPLRMTFGIEMMRRETVIIPLVFGTGGILLGVWAMSIVGKGWEHEVSAFERQVLYIVGPIAIAPLVATEKLGFNVHRLNIGTLAGLLFLWWAALGLVLVTIWHWFRARRTRKPNKI